MLLKTKQEGAMPRIAPIEPPYDQQTADTLRKWMVPGATQEPLLLFRLLQRNPELASRMRVLGAGLLGHGRLPIIDRELVIDRVCGLNRCSYEWGVHVAAFGRSAGLTNDQLMDTYRERMDDSLWSPRQLALIAAIDELHATSTISELVWSRLADHLDDATMLELIVLVGWYGLISRLANATELPDEPWTTAPPTAT
jgi:alkylhydroperoxidase family enzyme